MRNVIIMGAGGRDFHDFATVFRNDPEARVVAFTAAQVPEIDRRLYPPSLAGPLYPEGIPIRPEAELAELIDSEDVQEVVLSYSDLAHETVMHKASLALAAGADFRLLAPRSTMLSGSKPVVAVAAVRTGCGKSQTSRAIGRALLAEGLRVALVVHPMPYGDLEAGRVRRFASLVEIDRTGPTLEEREELEESVRSGLLVFTGVDYAQVLRAAEEEADVVVWDGGNNDLPFVAPDLLVTVADPLRAGDELTFHPGETSLRLANVVVINKVDSADPRDVQRVLDDVRAASPAAEVVFARSPVVLDPGPVVLGRRVLVVEDGPTLTLGGMPFGAGLVAARDAGAAEIVDPRPFAVGSIAETLATWPQLGNVVPATGYSPVQLRELEQTLAAADCDVVVTGTPIDLAHLIRASHPIRRARYELEIVGERGLEQLLAPIVDAARAAAPALAR